MEDQSEPKILGHQPEGGQRAPSPQHRGRPASWLTVVVLCAGYVVTGLCVVLWPAPILLGTGIALLAVGGLLAVLTDIFTDVVLDPPHDKSEEPHSTPLHRIKRGERTIERER